MPTTPLDVRRQAIRRVRYATNLLALDAGRVPPEGPFDAAMTNGLLAIVATEWPGAEANSKGWILSASALLDLIDGRGGLAVVDSATLREGVDLTQPFRHGRADDEFAVITDRHVAAVAALDAHPALGFVDSARERTLDECVVTAFRERADEELPFDLKDRLEVPEPDHCDNCWRQTFLGSGWDVFGGSHVAGRCIACGYEVSEDEAYEAAIAHAIRERARDDD